MTHAYRQSLATTVAPVLALLLCTGVTPAAAQTIISEPQQAQSTTVERTIIREGAVPARRAAKTDRRVTTTRPAPRAAVRTNRPATVRTTTHERIVTTPAPVRERIVAPATRTIVTGGPVDLSPAERAVVYRSIVERPVQRDIVVTEPAPRAPIVTQRIVTRPADARPLVTTEPDDDVDVVADVPVRRRIVPVPETTGAAVRAERVELVVGSRVPRSVPLYDIPSAAVAAAPTIGQYRYAQIEDRVYLVDPTDGVVVAELYQ